MNDDTPTDADSATGKISVADSLRADIRDGAFRAGEWLRQVDLESRYDVSRFEVRSALAKLQATKVVEHVANRGYRVASQSVNERNELTDTRLLLEVPAARMVAVRAQPADIERLDGIARAFDNALQNSSNTDIRALNAAFHREFFELCGNPTLAALINELRERVLPGDWTQWTNSARARLSSLDHLDIVEALTQRDLPSLEVAIARHLNRWREALRADGGIEE